MDTVYFISKTLSFAVFPYPSLCLCFIFAFVLASPLFRLCFFPTLLCLSFVFCFFFALSLLRVRFVYALPFLSLILTFSVAVFFFSILFLLKNRNYSHFFYYYIFKVFRVFAFNFNVFSKYVFPLISHCKSNGFKPFSMLMISSQLYPMYLRAIYKVFVTLKKIQFPFTFFASYISVS